MIREGTDIPFPFQLKTEVQLSVVIALVGVVLIMLVFPPTAK